MGRSIAWEFVDDAANSLPVFGVEMFLFPQWQPKEKKGVARQVHGIQHSAHLIDDQLAIRGRKIVPIHMVGDEFLVARPGIEDFRILFLPIPGQEKKASQK